MYTCCLTVCEEVFYLIQLSSRLYNQILEYCSHELPNEACGAFLGSYELDYIVIQNFIPIINVSPYPSKHFEFERHSLLRLLYPKQELPWIGIFHSHPLTAAYPSDEDLQSLWQVPVYAIISFEQSASPIMKSYEICSNQQKKPYSIKEQALKIIMSNP